MLLLRRQLLQLQNENLQKVRILFTGLSITQRDLPPSSYHILFFGESGLCVHYPDRVEFWTERPRES